MILNYYKPRGIFSFNFLSQVKRQLNVKKAGHAGTLDPLAEGVLVILTDADTKKQSDFMKKDKEYVAEVAFGIETETLDLERDPVPVNLVSLNELKSNLPQILQKYLGNIIQIVPMYSAKKVNGKALYKLALQQKSVGEDRRATNVTIYSIDTMDISQREIDTTEGKKTLSVTTIKINCSSGTYIRALVRDLGQDLGSSAVLIKLVRTRSGDYRVEDSIRL